MKYIKWHYSNKELYLGKVLKEIGTYSLPVLKVEFIKAFKNEKKLKVYSHNCTEATEKEYLIELVMGS